MKEDSFGRKVMNYMYVSICRTVNKLPFSGRHWLEQVTMGVAEYALKEHAHKMELTSTRPADICRSYMKLLDQEEFLDAERYRFKESGADEVIVSIDTNKCVYREYSFHAREEGLPFYCVRLATLQAVLKWVLKKDFSASVDIDWEKGVCNGRLFLTTQPKTEIVTRDGDLLKLADRRATLLPLETYASLLMSVKEHAPHALKHVLYDAGYQSGYYLASKAKAIYPVVEECLQLLLEEITNEGLGRVELISINLETGRASLRCYNSFQVAVAEEYGSLYRTPQVSCDFLRGIIAAYLTVLLGEKIVCEEMSCQAVEGDYCEFLALPFPKEYGGEEIHQ